MILFIISYFNIIKKSLFTILIYSVLVIFFLGIISKFSPF